MSSLPVVGEVVPEKVSGSLTLPKAVYRVDRALTVEAGATLNLAAGTQMLFGPQGLLLVLGTLRAVGSAAEPIVFAAGEENGRWGCVALIGKASDGSLLEHCQIRRGGGISGEFLAFRVLNAGSYERTTYGGGLYLRESSATIQHCLIADNESGSQGGGLYLSSSKSKLSHLEIRGNLANGSGGGIFMRDSSPVLYDVRITANHAKIGGGGAYIDASSDAAFYQCQFLNNRSDTVVGGGGLAVERSKLHLSECTVEENTAQGVSADGGGVSLAGSSANVIQSVIRGNEALRDGGGIFVRASSLKVAGGVIENNHAGRYGGGLFVRDSFCDMEETEIRSNDAKDGGGLASVLGARLVLTALTWLENKPNDHQDQLVEMKLY